MLLFLTSVLFAQPQSTGFSQLPRHAAHKVVSVDYAQAIERQVIDRNTPNLTLWEKFLHEDDETEALVLAHLIVQNESRDLPNDYRGEFLWSIAPAALVSAKKK